MDINQVKHKVKKASKWILLKKQRHEFRAELMHFCDEIEQNIYTQRKDMLEHYAALTTLT